MTLDEHRAAQILFGATATPPADDATSTNDDAPPPTSGSRLFGESSAERPGAWTTDATERDLFGADYAPPTTEMFSVETALRPSMLARLDDTMTVLQLSEEERHARHREFASIIRDSGLDPNVTGARLYDLLTDAEIAAVRGETTLPDDDVDAGVPPRVTEALLRRVRAWIGPERGEALVKALTSYVSSQPGLARILATPGVMTSPRFPVVLDEIAEFVRQRERI